MNAPERLTSLDLLRALAILAVMMFHSPHREQLGLAAHFGWVGVDLFFVLSGFLIANQFFKNTDPKRFYFRRALRTLPAYWVTLAIYFAIPVARESPDLPAAWRFLTFTQNFDVTARAFSHAWSLCIEEQFYLVFPLIALAKPNKYTIPALIALGALARAIVYHNIHGIDAFISGIYYQTYARLDGLLLGISIAAVKHHKPDVFTKIQRHPHALTLAGLALLATALATTNNRFTEFAAAAGFPLLAIAFATLTMAALSPGNLMGRLPFLTSGRFTLATPIALASYSTYLTHKMVFHLLREAPLIVKFASALVAGAAMYLVVERPFLELRDNRGVLAKICRYRNPL